MSDISALRCAMRQGREVGAGQEPPAGLCAGTAEESVAGSDALGMTGFSASLQINEYLRVDTRFKQSLLDLIDRTWVGRTDDDHVVDDQ